ncbi:MAG TPA: choice-of-anchor Q domain-containing protein [Methylomirabilota bacterium]
MALALASPCAAAIIECAAGDVACLIAAVNTANASGGANTIQLQSGTYSLTAPNNDTDGPNGLPSITGALTIVGAGAGGTIIEREATAPDFRLLHVAPSGLLKLEALTARGGRVTGMSPGGAGVLNRGTAVLSQSALTDCTTVGIDAGGGGGIVSVGRLVIAGSTLSHNSAGGSGGGASILGGLVTVVDSTISGNTGNLGGGLFIGGQLAIIIGSTIADNIATDGSGGGIFSSSTAVAVINSTLAGNFTNFGGGGLAGGGGIIINTTIANNDIPFGGDALFASSALAVYNTIVSGQQLLNHPACINPVTSLGNNLFSDPACAVTLFSGDLTGDPGLGDFTDDGTPGHGFLPLRRGSPALNAGDAGACLPADQRGRRRTARGCDIGAIEGTRP